MPKRPRISSGTKREPTPEERDLQSFLRLASERFQRCAEAEAEMRKQALDDVKFSLGEQWDSNVIAKRQRDSRPVLTLNRVTAFLKQITNSQRQQRPGITVNPVGSKSDPKVAEIEQGLIRHVEVNSDAEIAYDNAFDWMTRGGFGAWRFVTEYANDESFDQEIGIEWIEDPFTAYLDPDTRKYDKSDARFGFIIRDFGPEEYKSLYGDSSAASLTDFTSIGNGGLQFGLSKDRIRVAEYFYVEEEKGLLHRLADGSTMSDEDHKELYPGGANVHPDHVIEKSRPISKRKVKWAKINAIEKLEEKDWPGKYIPIVRLLGHSLTVDGKKHISGMVRDIKDPQRMYNFWVTAATEKIALDPKTPWMVAEGQDEGYEGEFERANRENLAVVHYKPTSVDGQLVPAPARQVVQSQIDGYVRLIAQADNDMKAITGIYDASLGQHGPDESGKAILARQKQTDVGTADYSDNLKRAMTYSGRILLDLFPKIYDAARVQRIIRPDGSVDHVGVFNSQVGGQTAEDVQQLEEMQDIKKIYDIGVGQYDVSVTMGPSYQSQRAEGVQAIMTLVSAYPALMQAAGDILVRNMDWPGAEEIADRLKKMLPPQLLGMDEGDDPEIQVQKLQGQLMQLSTQHQAVVQALQQATQVISSKNVEQSGKLAIAKMESETKIAVAEITTKAQDMLRRAQIELDLFKQFHAQAHDVGMEAMNPPQPAPAPTGVPGAPPPTAPAAPAAQPGA